MLPSAVLSPMSTFATKPAPALVRAEDGGNENGKKKAKWKIPVPVPVVRSPREMIN